MSGATDIGTHEPSTRVAALRDTGFPEPLSEERNTTIPHPDAAPYSELPEALIEEHKRRRLSRMMPGKHRNKSPKDIENEMYSGLETEENYDGQGGVEDRGRTKEKKHRHEGLVKKVLHKLSCGTV